MTRSYNMKARGKAQRKTRQRIVEAAIALHQEQGIAATSMADIAARAKVGRVTLYRHFPSEADLVGACSGLYFQRHPLPDPSGWREIDDARARLRHGLAAVFAHHRDTAAMMARVYGEARDHPIMADYHRHWRRLVMLLLAPWPVRGKRRRLLRAALSLALDFETWHFLTERQGLSDAQAVALQVRAVAAQADEDGV